MAAMTAYERQKRVREKKDRLYREAVARAERAETALAEILATLGKYKDGQTEMSKAA
jgi:hypothetical protein